jgi:hypothetical protein
MLPPETVHVMVAGPTQSALVPGGEPGPEYVKVYVRKVSDVLQPVPVTLTLVPVGPKLGVSVNIGFVTVNGTEIDPCTTEPPEIVTVCGPKVAVVSTTYVPERTPSEPMAHVTALKVGDGVPTTAAEQSGVLAEYPEPEIVPEPPRLLLFGVNAKLDSTMKFVIALPGLTFPTAFTG